MHIAVDRSRCIGAGLCALKLPTIFQQDAEEGLVELLDDTGDGYSDEEASQAEYECPSQAITVTPTRAESSRA